jgi:hypothetical protein
MAANGRTSKAAIAGSIEVRLIRFPLRSDLAWRSLLDRKRYNDCRLFRCLFVRPGGPTSLARADPDVRYILARESISFNSRVGTFPTAKVLDSPGLVRIRSFAILRTFPNWNYSLTRRRASQSRKGFHFSTRTKSNWFDCCRSLSGSELKKDCRCPLPKLKRSLRLDVPPR